MIPDRMPAPVCRGADRSLFRCIRRMIHDGYGVDDAHVATGASYLVIWGALKRAHRFGSFRGHQRIALIRASYERGIRRAA